MKVKRIENPEVELNFTGATLLSQFDIQTLDDAECEYACAWWLSSPCSGDSMVYTVNEQGKVTGYYCHVKLCVRPALIISNLADTKFEIGDYFEANHCKFKIMTSKLAFMIDGDIGTACFDKESNDYQTSSIKKMVDEWYFKFTQENYFTVDFGKNGIAFIGPKNVNVSKFGFFDELEYDCWDLIKKYLQRLGFKNNFDKDDIDFYAAKTVQDKILAMLIAEGVYLNF